MAESRRYILTKQLDLDEILQEAGRRWLRPPEICEILRNYQKFQLTPDPPVRPPAGSLFLFDRKALRYFRKDGHRWRKKKDGKTVKEAHEKLKAGSVDVLHCYYAHGEDNENFQRRSYWMLDEKLEHIVLVHYREVKEGYKAAISHFPVNSVPLVGSPQGSSAQVNSPISLAQTSYASSANRVDWNGRALSPEYEDVDSASGHQSSSHTQPIGSLLPHSPPLLAHEANGFPQLSRSSYNSWSSSLPSFCPGNFSSTWPFNQNTSSSTGGLHDRNLHVEGFTEGSKADLNVHKLEDARLDADNTIQDAFTCRDRMFSDLYVQSVLGVSKTVKQVEKEHDLNADHSQFCGPSDHPAVETSSVLFEQKLQNGSIYNGGSEHNKSGELKKLDSFGRWLDKEIGGDCDDSLMASDSGNYWNTLNAPNGDKEVSSLQMQLDMDSLGPSLSQEQLFTFHEFSPDWAYSGVKTKVLIVGTFLGSKKLSTERKWGCMFGEIEVSAEVLTDNVIRCYTPLHLPGRVPFYVTCSNRLACSEVREFEYRENPTVGPKGVKITPKDEIYLQLRLLKLVDLGPEKKWLNCSISQCDKCKLKETMYSMRNESGLFQDTLKISESDYVNPRDVLIQRLLRDKLYEWLVFKVHEEGKGPHELDNEGQGVIHLAASLGYAWAMYPLAAAGINPNFRDARGRTGLHWASYFGREETVIVLIKLGAAPGAVEDPTSIFPEGLTAADLASSRGHKGIAAYLAEADLTSRLSTLTVNENEMDNIDALKAADSAFETAQADSSNMTMDEQRHLKESLAVFRKSARAAALVQAAFRARSFHQRQLTKTSSDISEAELNLVAAGSSSKFHKTGHFEDYLHFAALKIQKKYHGWKGRKEFLKIRNRIVKIQAHVRGHQVRKQYKKVVWSVSIVEKAILRWRRKGAGLRGFRVQQPVGIMASGAEKSDEYEFLSIGRRQKSDNVNKALARVKSMLHHPEARDQYMRLVMKFQNSMVGDGGTS